MINDCNMLSAYDQRQVTVISNGILLKEILFLPYNL